MDAIERIPRHQNESDLLLNKWSPECEQAFLKAEKQLTSDKCLIFYDLHMPLLLANTDASPTCVGAVLSHKFPDETERTIMYIS